MLVFFKRYRMQVDLRDAKFTPAELTPPAGFELLGWRPSLLAAHGQAKYRSFANELDANVFPCLGNAEGCHRLMREITNRRGFVPESTWLLVRRDQETGGAEYIGTVQGISENSTVGLIQNIGVDSAYRGLGLGSIIVKNALAGFQRAGSEVVTLEVTAKNEAAIRLYHRLGFEIERTVYKSIDAPTPWND